MTPQPARVIWSLMGSTILVACIRLPVPPGYDFVTHTLPRSTDPVAVVEGSLVLTGGPRSDGYCLLVVRGSRDVTLVAWPERFHLLLAEGGMFTVSGDGVRLQQGDGVRLGGVEVTTGLYHSSPGGCPAYSPYFAVTSLP